MSTDTKQRLLEAGLGMLLQHGYNDLGIQALLQSTGVPKGSFYHHFASKEDFALQVVDRYMVEVHAGLDATLADETLPPLDRIRRFFELTTLKYQGEGYLGCMLGGLGQELSGASEVFRKKIEWCFDEIASRIAVCLEEARARGDLPADCEPRPLADRIIDCWEGAALRCRLRREPEPLEAMLDFYFSALTATARKTAVRTSGDGARRAASPGSQGHGRRS